VGLRIHVGGSSPSHTPLEVRLFGRTVRLEEGARRWYDLPLQPSEVLQADREVSFYPTASSHPHCVRCSLSSAATHSPYYGPRHNRRAHPWRLWEKAGSHFTFLQLLPVCVQVLRLHRLTTLRDNPESTLCPTQVTLVIGPTLHEGCAPRLDQLEAYAQGKDALRWPATAEAGGAEAPTAHLRSSNPLPPKLLMVGGQLTPLLLAEDLAAMEYRVGPPPPVAQVTSSDFPKTLERSGERYQRWNGFLVFEGGTGARS
jgi:hypothetical protein